MGAARRTAPGPALCRSVWPGHPLRRHLRHPVRHPGSGPRPAASLVAVALACLLGLTIGSAARAHATHHLHRGLVTAAASIGDPPGSPQRGEQTAVVAAAPAVTALTRGPAGTADSSAADPVHTARAPQVRGPPSEADA